TQEDDLDGARPDQEERIADLSLANDQLARVVALLAGGFVAENALDVPVVQSGEDRVTPQKARPVELLHGPLPSPLLLPRTRAGGTAGPPKVGKRWTRLLRPTRSSGQGDVVHGVLQTQPPTVSASPPRQSNERSAEIHGQNAARHWPREHSHWSWPSR